MSTLNISLFLYKTEKTSLNIPHLPPDLTLWLNLSGPIYKLAWFKRYLRNKVRLHRSARASEHAQFTRVDRVYFRYDNHKSAIFFFFFFFFFFCRRHSEML